MVVPAILALAEASHEEVQPLHTESFFIVANSIRVEKYFIEQLGESRGNDNIENFLLDSKTKENIPLYFSVSVSHSFYLFYSYLPHTHTNTHSNTGGCCVACILPFQVCSLPFCIPVLLFALGNFKN